jgi:AcrR family transcriptional regulator
MDSNTAAIAAGDRTDRRTTPPVVATGYPRKRARTRRQLLVAAMAVLADHGPDGATVGEIARRAHVSPGTFYNHFEDLAALTDAVVDDLAAGVEIGSEQLQAVEHDAAARVAIGTRQLLDLAADEPDTARAFVALLATVPAFRDRIRSTVRGAIDDGIAQGRFERRPAAMTTDAVIGAVTQWMRTRLSGEHDRSPDTDHLEFILHVAGLRDDDARVVAERAAP